VAWGTTAGRLGRGQRDTVKPSRVHTRGRAIPPLQPSSLLFLRLLSTARAHSTRTISMKHSVPWHCSPTLRGQLDGESEFKPGATPSNLSRRRRGRRAVAEKAKPSSRCRGDEAVEI
jgi:hypothetical protein